MSENATFRAATSRDTGASQVAAAVDAANSLRAGALVGYLPIGFPDLATSVDAAVAVVEGGVDVLELGLPYSDPVLDGPVIQDATQRSLAAGFHLGDVFAAVREVRERVSAPVLVMTYWNPVLQYGVARFAGALREAGGAGLITPDLTPENAADWLAAAEANDLDRVFLAAPSSSEQRLRGIIDASRGFVYTVSTMGITGARSTVDEAARILAGRLHALGAERACVGLGISSGQQVREVLRYAEGAIVGSALVRALAQGGIDAVRDKARELASGARRDESLPGTITDSDPTPERAA